MPVKAINASHKAMLERLRDLHRLPCVPILTWENLDDHEDHWALSNHGTQVGEVYRLDMPGPDGLPYRWRCVPTDARRGAADLQSAKDALVVDLMVDYALWRVDPEVVVAP